MARRQIPKTLFEEVLEGGFVHYFVGQLFDKKTRMCGLLRTTPDHNMLMDLCHASLRLFISLLSKPIIECGCP